MIEKVIHYCWFGYGEKPELFNKCIESWRKFCPDYKIVEWDESNFDVHQNTYISQAYDNKEYAFVADFARLWIVYNYGGIYLDTDVELVKPLDDLLGHKAFFGTDYPGGIATGLGFGSEPNNPIIAEMMKVYDSLLFVNAKGSFNYKPCSKYQTKALKKYGLVKKDVIQNIDNGNIVYPVEYFCPKEFYEEEARLTPNTYANHHYSLSWMPEDSRKALDLSMKYRKYMPLYIAHSLAYMVVFYKQYGFKQGSLKVIKTAKRVFSSDRSWRI